jgi:hypothetical protein
MRTHTHIHDLFIHIWTSNFLHCCLEVKKCVILGENDANHISKFKFYR